MISDLRFLGPVFVLTLAACSGGSLPSGESESEAQPETSASEIKGASCRGVLATDATHYAASAPNVARELAASLAPSFVVNGSAFLPGVLRASSSQSPYAYAATLELATWSTMSTTAFDGAPAANGSLVIRLQGHPVTDANGKAAKVLFDAMTNAAQTSESGAVVRRSANGSVVCASSAQHVQCALGPVGHVEQTSACPR